MTDSTSAHMGKLALLVALLAFLVGANALKNDLVYDAHYLVKSNATFKAADQVDSIVGQVVSLNALFKEGFWDGVNRTIDASRQVLGQSLYRPLMLYPMGLIYVTVGDGSVAYNLLNLLFHVLTSLVVLKLALILVKNRRVAMIAALIFAVHPLHAEAIAYVAGIGETQSAFFGLLALVLYLGAVTRERLRLPVLALAWLAFAVALFTKEGAATILVLAILADFARKGDAPRPSRRALAYVGFLAIIAINLVIRHEMFGRLAPNAALISPLDNPLVIESFGARLATGVTLFTRALQLFILPIGQSADYSFNQLPIAKSLLEIGTLTSFAVCALLTILGFRLLRAAPAVGFGALAFLFTFGAVSNIPVLIGTIFGERLVYLPSVGLSLLAAGLLTAILRQLEAKGDVPARVMKSVMIVGLVALCILTWSRNAKYKSIDVLYNDMVKTAPDSARAYYQRGELERKKASEGYRESLTAAAYDFRRATEIMKRFFLAHLQLASVLAESGQYKEAKERLQLAEQLIPPGDVYQPIRDDIKRRTALILAQIAAGVGGQGGDAAAALAELLAFMEDHVAANPDDVGSAVELATMYLKVGRRDDARSLTERLLLAFPNEETLRALRIQVVVQTGDLAEGQRLIEEFGETDRVEIKKVLALYTALIHFHHAFALNSEKGFDAALPEYDKAIALLEDYITAYPEDDQGYYWHGLALHESHDERHDEALADYQQVVKLNPSNQDVYLNIARLLVYRGNINANTVKFVSELSKLYPDNPILMLGAGRVYTEVPMHEEAAKAYKRAIELGLNGAEPHCLLAKELIDLGNPTEALNVLKEGEQKFGFTSPQVPNTRGVALFQMKRYTDALNQFEVALRMAQQDPQFQGAVSHLRFQRAKTLLRIEGSESEGLRILIDVQDQLEAAVERAAKKTREVESMASIVAYCCAQRAWARLNVESMKDVDAAVALLEKADQIGTKYALRDVLRDVLPDLAAAYDTAGEKEKAEAVRKRMAAPPATGSS